MAFGAITAEQRASWNETRRARAATLRSDLPSDDEAEWSRLAKEQGIKLPPYGVACSTAGMKRFLAKLGISVPEYLDWDGSRRMSDFPTRNPTWPLKAWVALILEAIDSARLRRSAQ